MKKIFIISLVVFLFGFTADVRCEFTTGTDDNANFYFPDTFAQWVGFNFDDKITREQMEGAVNTICTDLNSTRDQDREAFKSRYAQLLGDAWANAIAYSAKTVKEMESEGTAEDLDNMIGLTGGVERTQMSGMGEISMADVEQNKKELVMLADDIQTRVFEEILTYCNTYNEGRDEKLGESFANGTDDHDIFYFPQGLAMWCSLNFDEEIDESRIGECFNKIALDLRGVGQKDIERGAAKAKMHLRELKKEVWINAFVVSHEIKQKYASIEIDEKVEQVQENDDGDHRMQTTGNSEIQKYALGQMRDLKRLRGIINEMRVYDIFEANSEIFIVE